MPANPPVFRPPLPGRLAQDGDILYAVNDPPESGVYRHPAGLFVLHFPGTWRMMRSINGGYVSYTFSAEAGRVPPKQIRAGAKVLIVAMSDVFRRQHMTASAVLTHFLPGILRGEPGMKLTGSVTNAKLGGLEAAMCTLRGTGEDHAGEATWEIYVAVKEGVTYQLTCFAPTEQLAGLQPTFAQVVGTASFGRKSLPRLERSLEARQIAEKYEASVVSIDGESANGSRWTGSGFIISRDGYVLTNYHVAYDLQTRQPAKSLRVEWDHSLGRASVPAQLVGGKVEAAVLHIQPGIYGTDVALLKMAPGDYVPLPLSRVAEIKKGDDVVTLGFPSRGMLEGVSLTVTKGVVARVNLDPDGEVQSLFTDARFTHGSSGGPCVSLVTGGVIGLNSFGMPIQLDPRMAHLNDLINYNGIVPIDDAVREFALVCTPGMNPEGTGLDFLDCLDLSKYFVSVGSFKTAEQLALRAVSLEPQQAVARMRLGECRVQLALEELAGGDHDTAAALFAAARKAYGEALARDPRQPDALVAFAQLELQQNRLPEATDLATKATAADPKDWQGHLLLADIGLRQSRFDEALQHVDKAKVVTGGLIVNPHVSAAQIYTAKKEFENARKEWAQAARISPVYLPARLGVAGCFELAHQADQALAEYHRILEDFPENGEVLGRIGLCLTGAGRTAEAADYFMQSVIRCGRANRPPDESVLMYLGDALLQRPESSEAAPVFALYLFHYRRGQFAAIANLKLADIHAKHGSPGLASAHARMALELGNAPEVARAAQQYPAAPLALTDIQAMIGVLQYPMALAVDIIASSPLGFAIQGDEQLQQLQQSGMPPEILQAILSSLSQHPPMIGSAGMGVAATPPEAAPPSAQPLAPPNTVFPPAASPPGVARPNLVGTWVATGMTSQQVLFRSVIIFGDLGLFSSDTWVGLQSLGRMSGRYWFENGRLILQPDGGQPFAPACQVEGDTIVMDVVNFAAGVRFTRQMNTGFPP